VLYIMQRISPSLGLLAWRVLLPASSWTEARLDLSIIIIIIGRQQFKREGKRSREQREENDVCPIKSNDVICKNHRIAFARRLLFCVRARLFSFSCLATGIESARRACPFLTWFHSLFHFVPFPTMWGEKKHYYAGRHCSRYSTVKGGTELHLFLLTASDPIGRASK